MLTGVQDPGPYLCRLVVVRGRFACRVLFLLRVPGLFQVVCQLFLCLRAPLSDDAHLLGRRILVPDSGTGMAGFCCTPGSAVGRSRIGNFFAHDRIVPQPLPEKKSRLGPGRALSLSAFRTGGYPDARGAQ